MKLATLTDVHLYTFDTQKQEYRTFDTPAISARLENAADILSLMDVASLDTLWILSMAPVSTIAGNMPIWFENAEGYKLLASKKLDGSIKGLYAYRTSGDSHARRSLRVVFLEHSNRWGLKDVIDAPALLRIMKETQERIKIPLEISPGATFRSLMKATISVDAFTQPENVIGTFSAPSPLKIKKQLTRDDLAKSQLLILDKKGMYLRACTGVELGIGTPQEYLEPLAHFDFSEKLPGLWEVTVTDKDGYVIHDGEAWTPLVHYYKRQGYSIEIRHAWVWPEHKALLRPLAERLWIARESTEDAAVKRLVKLFYTQGLGWLNMKQDNAQFEDAMYRPDWDAMIKEHAFSIMRFKIHQLESHGYRIVWANVDEIGFMVDDVYEVLDNQKIMNGYQAKYGGGIPLEECGWVFETDIRFSQAQTALYELGYKVKRG